MRAEFFIDASRGLNGVLEPVTFLECPTTREGYIRVGGRASLSMGNGEQHSLILRCDAFSARHLSSLESLIDEAGNKGIALGLKSGGGTHTMTVPINGLRSQWANGRLLCYAEVGSAPSASMEIPGVATVLVLCDRADHFQHYFRQRQPDLMAGDIAEFGGTRYICIMGQHWRGFRPDATRWTILGHLSPGRLRDEAEAIAWHHDRIYLEEEDRPLPAEGRMTAAEVMEQRERSRHRGFTGSRMVRREYVDGIPVREVDLGEVPSTSSRMEVGVVDHESLAALSEYIRTMPTPMARVIRPGEDLPITRRSLMTGLNGPLCGFASWTGVDRFRVNGIGDTSCLNNARDRHLRCAVNPMGPCEGCSHFEARTD